MLTLAVTLCNVSALAVVCPVLPVGVQLSGTGSTSARPAEPRWLHLLEERPSGSVCADIEMVTALSKPGRDVCFLRCWVVACSPGNRLLLALRLLRLLELSHLRRQDLA